MEVPEYLLQIAPSEQRPASCLAKIVTELTEKLQEQSKENNCQKADVLEMTSKQQQLCGGNQRYEEELQKKTIEITELQAKIATCEGNEVHLKNVITTQENNLKDQEEKFHQVGNPDYDNIVQLEAFMKRELDSIGKVIKESLSREVQESNKQIEAKLNKCINKGITYADAVRNVDTSIVCQTKPPEIEDFRSIMRKAKNEELAEESERKRWANNIIIHGVKEAIDVDKNGSKEHDEKYVK